MACHLCDLGSTSFQAMPVGSSNPDIYVVFDKPAEDELRFGDLSKGIRGQYLINSLASVGIRNIRIFSVIRCLCEDNPETSQVEQCLKFLRSDIYRTNPKVILTAGAFPTNAILGTDTRITNVRGLVKTIDINGHEFPVVPIYSPTYVINKYSSTEVTGEFMRDLANAAKIVTGEYLNPMDRNVMEFALDYETFRRFYEENLEGEEMLAYDIETNAELVYSENFRICGWSLAKEGVGIYVCLESLDYTMSESDRKACEELLVRILKETPKIVVHNSLYERPATYYQYGYEMPFEQVEDTLVMAKIMLGGKVGAGLKPNARRIGYPEWDADISTYIDNFIKAVKRCSLKKFHPIVESMKSGRTFQETFEELGDPEKFEEMIGYFESISKVISRYYNDSEIPGLSKLISQKFVEGYDNGTTAIIPYTWVPKRIICKYGATDSLATFDLYNYFLEQFEKESTDEVHLDKGYYYDLMEHNTGYELMMAGIHWDDKSASRDSKVYNDMATKSLHAMLLCGHPSMDKRVAEAYRVQYGPKIIYESYNDWFWEKCGRRIEMKDDDTYVSVFLKDNGKEWRRPVRFFFDEEGLEIPESIERDLNSKIIGKAKEDIRSKDYTELKDVLNPGSPMKWVADLYNDIVMDDDFRVGFFINKVRDNILQNEEIDRDKYSETEKNLISAIESYLEIPRSNHEERRLNYEPLKAVILSTARMDSEDMREFLGDMRNLRLDKVAEDYQLLTYESLISTTVDPDDYSTWTDQFKWNFYLRLFKKSVKIVTAYLEGTTGRQSVYMVDADRLHRGEDVVLREKHISDAEFIDGVPQLPKGKDWLNQSNFGVGTAETGRWRCLSGDTLIPLLDGRLLTIKEIYDNDMKDFYVYSYDQTENKVVPGYCKYAHITGHDAEMIEVLLDTGDVIKCTQNHKFVMRNGHKKMAGELVPGDSLMPLNRRINDNGYELIQQPNGEWELTHKVVMSDKMGSDYSSIARGSHHCHHKDTNKLNNDPRNLLWINKKDHRLLHTRIHHRRLKEDSEYRDHYLPNMQASARNMIEKREKNPTYRQHHKEQVQKLIHSMWNDSEWEEWRKHQREVSRQSMKKLTDAQHNPDNPDYHKYDEWREKNKKQASNLNLTRAYNLARDFYEANGYINESGYNSVRKRGFMTWNVLTNKLGGVEELVRMIENHEKFNHQVIAIRDAGVEGTVYDLTVELYHTFCISPGRGAEIFLGNSGIHTMPAGSTIKRLMTSRFKGGTIFQPDFSANELRCVASMAHEENMLEAFRNGLDIHRSNASRIFRVPFEEVTTYQRRWAKTLSFMTLYGGNAKTLADSYFNGDMARATEQLNSFYGAFPGLKTFIEAKHDEVMRTHKVATLTDRFITIDFDPNDKRSTAQAMRESVNYPIQSFPRSTGVLGLDGKVHTLGELADNHEDLWIYSYDTENHKIVPVKGVQAQCTGTTDTWYEIVLDNGESVKVTPEHLMMLRDGNYVEARNLEVGQSLMPLYLDKSSDDDRPSFHRGVKIQKWVHDSIYGNVPGTSVHHVNVDPNDNRPENLIRLRNSYHIAYHRNFYEYLVGSKTFEEFISVVRPEIIRNYPENYEERLEDIRRIVDEIPDDRKKELAKNSMSSRNQRRSEDFKDWDSNQRKAVKAVVQRRLEETGNVLGMDKESYSKRLSESWEESREYRMERLKEGHNSPEARKHHSEASKKRQDDPNYVFNMTRTMLGYFIENNLPWHTVEEWDGSAKLYPKSSGRRYSKYIESKMDWDEFIERADDYASTYNHKIVDIKIIHLDEPEPKYDLHIPKYHNFALSCGVFTHNSSSSTMAAVVFCDVLLYMKRNGFKSKGICFIHDSLESDIAPYELIEIINYQQDKLAHGAVDYFGIECKADMSMGYSMGHECEMPEIEILDDKFTKANITLKGSRNDIYDTINNWKLAYHRVEVIEEDFEDHYYPLSEMFISRKAFDAEAMSWQKEGTIKVYIQYYNDKGEIDPMETEFTPYNIWDGSTIYQLVKDIE